ncbi:hypothetical protein EAO71_37130, partial [Streptomyces sp. ms191]
MAEAAAAVADAQAAAAGQANKFDQAMAKLAPNARAFVNAIRGLAPAWREMKLSVQNRLFSGLDTAVTSLAGQTIPILQQQLTATAGIWNAMGKSAITAVSDMAKTGLLEKVFEGANKSFAELKDAPGQLITAFSQLSVAAQPAFQKLMGGLGNGIASISDRIAKSFASGGLEQAINTAFTLLSQLGSILGDAFGTVGNIMKAATDAGAQALSVVGELFAELRRVTAMPEIQSALRSIFAAVAQIAAAIAPVIGAGVQALLPLIAAIAPVIADLAKTLGPVLTKVVQALGKALEPLIKALLPVVTLVGDALIRMVAALTPLLEPIGKLLAAIIKALLPALTPVVNVITRVVESLAGPLVKALEACMPLVSLLGELISQVFGALEPLIEPLLDVVTSLAGLFVSVLSTALTQVMKAIQPLIPMFVTLITALVAGLLPVLPTLTEALMLIVDVFLDLGVSLIEQLLPPMLELSMALVDLIVALAPILPPLSRLILMVTQLGVSVLSWLLPPIVRLVGYLAGKVASTLSGTIRWISDLVSWIRVRLGPAFRWLNDVVIQPVWRGIRSAFDGMRTGAEKVGTAFKLVSDAIGKQWGRLRDFASNPIKFIIDTVYNKGIVLLWNKVAGSFGGKKLGEFHPPGFATGGVAEGVRPGYTPGRDNALIAVGGGEAIMRPEWTRAVGAGYVNSMNAAARSGGISGVQKALGLPGFADGGIVGFIKDAAGLAGDLLTDPSKAWEKITSPIRKLVSGMGNTPWIKLAAGIPGKLLSTLKDSVIKAAGNLFGGGEGSAPAGGSGGSGVQRWRGTVLQALGLVGQPAAYADITLRRMNQESGGNPNIVNRWDSNWIAGHPSVGLMQVIGPTFRAYAGKMAGVGPFAYGVSTNPLANI